MYSLASINIDAFNYSMVGLLVLTEKEQQFLLARAYTLTADTTIIAQAFVSPPISVLGAKLSRYKSVPKVPYLPVCRHVRLR